MDLQFQKIDDARRFQEFQTLLRASSLPADDLQLGRDLLIGYYEKDELVGTGALEVYGAYGLLRSLSVKFGIRGRSVGSSLTDHIIAEARARNLGAIYLLTETAPGFFSKKGFVQVKRAEVPVEVQRSSEFSKVCPENAIVMMRTL